MKKKYTFDWFVENTEALSIETNAAIIGGRSAVPTGVGSTGMVNWGDIDIRSHNAHINSPNLNSNGKHIVRKK